jgi:hypothetical protein
MWDEGFCCADRPKHVHRAENLFVRKTFKRTRETVAGIVEQPQCWQADLLMLLGCIMPFCAGPCQA